MCNRVIQLVDHVQNNYSLHLGMDQKIYAKSKYTKMLIAFDDSESQLRAEFFTQYNAVFSSSEYKQAVTTLKGIAEQTSMPEPINLRIAKFNDSYYIDLGIPDSDLCVLLNHFEWKCVPAPVLFYRPQGLRPLPCPSTHGANLDLLWNYVNVPKHSAILVLAWIVDSYRCDTQYTILELFGHPGSGKTLAQHICVSLTDPSEHAKLSEPTNPKSIIDRLAKTHVLGFENVSHLNSRVQDTLCMVSTGISATNPAKTSGSITKPVIINSLYNSISRADLLSRTYSIELKGLESSRRPESELLASFDTDAPIIFAGILDIAVKAFKRLPEQQVPLEDRPRMLDFTALAMAISCALDGSADMFWDAFNANQLNAAHDVLSGQCVGPAVKAFVTAKAKNSSIEDTLSNLYTKVKAYADSPADFPKTPRAFGNELRSLHDILRSIGIHCEAVGRRKDGIIWKFTDISTD